MPANTPYPQVMDCIIQHESGGEQYSPNGSVLTSPTNDLGIFQINSTWLPLAKRMGLDITKEKDNVEFGVFLYQKYGPTIWATYKQYCSDIT